MVSTDRLDILNPGLNLTLRPMKYPQFHDLYKVAIENTWNVNEVSFDSDINDIKFKLSLGERHLIKRLVAFFATGDTIVSNNLVLGLYKHINSPEARIFLSRQLEEEAQHIIFYLTLLDSYIPDSIEREEIFKSIDNIPSIKKKADFCFKYTDNLLTKGSLDKLEDKKEFIQNLVAYTAGVEGLFFFSAFAYVYHLRSRGFLHGLATGTNWVFRDESGHIVFGNHVIRVLRSEYPELFNSKLLDIVYNIIDEAVECEDSFAEDILSEGVTGLELEQIKQYIRYIADLRLEGLGFPKKYQVTNPLQHLTEFQDVQELTNFFERKVSSYRVGISGKVRFDAKF